MKKLIISFFALVQICGVTLAAEEAVQNSDSVTSIFELTEEVEKPANQPMQFFLGDSTERFEKDFDAEFLYQALVNRLNSDFSLAGNFITWALVAIVFMALVFSAGVLAQHFLFRSKVKAELREFKYLAQAQLQELQKEHDIRENNLQSIVNQQRDVLEELKKVVEEKVRQINGSRNVE